RIVSCDLTTGRVWDAKTGSALVELKGKTGEMVMAAFSPDGSRIVTGGSGTDAKGLPKGVATVWDATTGKPLVGLVGLTSMVEGVAFSPDGARFFTYPRYGKALAWNARTGKEVPGDAVPPLEHKGRTSPDSRYFARLMLDRVE